MMEINKNILDKMLGNDLIITGGHFLILENGKPNLNPGTIDSFKAAVVAYKTAREKNLNVHLGILINNMGGVCDTKKNICVIDPEEIKKVFKLPDPYLELLAEVKVQPESVKIYWEKSLRNRGKKELLKKIKQENGCIEYKEGAYWFVNPKDGRRITLSRPNPNDKYGIA
ncbi:MAG: hypothetical protein Q8N88_02330, partial [Nanoarchaeota archaeon]|nr:hypothetical protein [Nanoarchaeota archaeon]